MLEDNNSKDNNRKLRGNDDSDSSDSVVDTSVFEFNTDSNTKKNLSNSKLLQGSLNRISTFAPWKFFWWNLNKVLIKHSVLIAAVAHIHPFLGKRLGFLFSIISQNGITTSNHLHLRTTFILLRLQKKADINFKRKQSIPSKLIKLSLIRVSLP